MNARPRFIPARRAGAEGCRMDWRTEKFSEPKGAPRRIVRMGGYGVGRSWDAPAVPVRVSVVDLENDVAGLDPEQQRARDESRAAQDELMRWVASLDDDRGKPDPELRIGATDDAAEELLLAMARAEREAAERREAAAYHADEYAWASALGREED